MKNLKISPLAAGLKATVDIPGSKSYTNRALLIAAMTPQSVKIKNLLLSDDTQAMISCLEQLGLELVHHQGLIEVAGDITSVTARDYDLDVNLSGTTLRFILALSTLIPGVQTLHGRPGLHNRPIGDMVTALTHLGAEIEYLGQEGYPPLRITSSKLLAGTVTLPGTESSQYLSALLMIAPLIGNLKIAVTGELISKPFVAMTTDIMKQFGVQVTSTAESYYIAAGQTYNQSTYVVEGDVSSASYFLASAALTKSTITTTNMNPHSLQADMSFLKILAQMGNTVSYGQNDSITVSGSGVRPVTVNMQDCPDQAPTLAVLAAFAKGTTTISGIQSLRIKETERIQALQQELHKMGIQTASTPDTLVIHGGQPHATSIATYGDHRMAMSFAVAGTKLPGMEIQDPDVVSKTFPDFWEKLVSLGNSDKSSKSDKQNIVLIGMRGTGKTTIARSLADRLHREHIDLDETMVKKTGLATARLVEKYGWEYFRDEEAAIAKETAALRGKVISTGGGVVLKPANIAALKAHGYVILLKASAEVLVKRLEDTADSRPKLTAQKTLVDEIRQVMRERRQAYEMAADTVIDTDELGPSEVVAKIIDLIKEQAV
jgi:3-phosphoshikimate 1-carboxyvinyltransferase